MSSKKIWKMKDFYNEVADGYDEHMREVILDFDEYYDRLIKPIKNTEEKIRIANLGCGTGPELKNIFEQCPNAQVTCVDIAENMLDLLSKKYEKRLRQIDLITESYETVELEENAYDYIVCAMCLHHYDYDRKIQIFKRIHKFLKVGGMYIEGDFIATPEQEKTDYEVYKEIVANNPDIATGNYHVDVTSTVYTEIKYLNEAGFKRVDVLYKDENKGILIGFSE